MNRIIGKTIQRISNTDDMPELTLFFEDGSMCVFILDKSMNKLLLSEYKEGHNKIVNSDLKKLCHAIIRSAKMLIKLLEDLSK